MAIILIEPQSQSVPVGGTFTVNISIDPQGVPISGAQLDLSFNSSVIQAISITEGGLFKQGGQQTIFNPGTTNNSIGTLTNVFGLISGPNSGVTTKNVFATIRFNVVGQGSSPITLSNVIISDVNSQIVPTTIINGSLNGSTAIITTTSYPNIIDAEGSYNSSTGLATALVLFNNSGGYGYVYTNITDYFSGIQLSRLDQCLYTKVGLNYIGTLQWRSPTNLFNISMGMCNSTQQSCLPTPTCATTGGGIQTSFKNGMPIELFNPTVPPSPGISMTPGNGSITVNITPPNTTASIFAYYIGLTIGAPSGDTIDSGFTNQTLYTFTGLTNGQTYYVTVYAISRSNVYGAIVYGNAIPIAPIGLGSITLTVPLPSINIGVSEGIISVCRNTAGAIITCPTLIWTSNNTSIATVSSTGIIRGVAAGSCVITASSGSVSGSVTVIITAPLASISITPTLVTINTVGSTQQLVATCIDSNGTTIPSCPTLTWTSDNTSVATVSSTGLVTAVSRGTASITCSNGSIVSNTSIINVGAPLGSIVLNAPLLSINIGSIEQIGSVCRDNLNNIISCPTLVWTSSNTSVATVSTTGVLTAISPGSIIITAISGTISGSVSVTVISPLGTITISPSPISIGIGSTQIVTAICKNTLGTIITCPTLVWTSSNTTIATITQTGTTTALITAISSGTANIYCSGGGITSNISIVTVSAVLSTITISPSSATVLLGMPRQLTAICKDNIGNTITCPTLTWTSSNTAIATVSPTGATTALVKSIIPGTANISCSGGGKTSNISVITVVLIDPNVVPVSMTLDKVVADQNQAINVSLAYRNNSLVLITGFRAVIWAGNIPFASAPIDIPASISGSTTTIIIPIVLSNIGIYLIKPEISDSMIPGSCSGTTAIYGDVNSDGKIDSSDVTALTNIVIGTPPTLCQRTVADLKRLGSIDAGDAVILINYINGTIPSIYSPVGRRVVTLPSQSVTIVGTRDPDIIPISITLDKASINLGGTVNVTITYRNNSANTIITPNIGLLWINNVQYSLPTPGGSIAAGAIVNVVKTISGLSLGTYLIKPEIPDQTIVGSCTATTIIYGDINGDGKVDNSDATALTNIVTGISPTLCQKAIGDLKRTGSIDIGDTVILINYISGSISSTYSPVGRRVVTLPSKILTVVAQAIITATSITLTATNPCLVGICSAIVNVTWKNNGTISGSFVPNISVDSLIIPPIYPSETLAAGASITHQFTISGFTTGSHTICPIPN